MTKAATEADQGLMNVLWVLGGARAAGASLPAQLRALDGALDQLRPSREVFEREEATRWLEAQGRTLKPRKPRNTAAKRRRELLAELAAADAARGR